jgi:uncharacterized membrane protein
MNKWIVLAGYILIIIGALLFAFAAGYFPLEFALDSSSTEATFYKIVPNENTSISAYVFLALGFVMVVFGKLLKSKESG